MTKGILWIKLDNGSKNKLIEKLQPLYEVVYVDHVTLKYPAILEEVSNLIGRKEKIQLTRHLANEEIEAAEVKIDSNLVLQKRKPHLTISAKKGVPPVKSRNMIESSRYIKDDSLDIEVEGEVEFFRF